MSSLVKRAMLMSDMSRHIQREEHKYFVFITLTVEYLIIMTHFTVLVQSQFMRTVYDDRINVTAVLFIHYQTSRVFKD